MWRAGLVILMLSIYATGCIAQQLEFFAAQGLIRVDTNEDNIPDTLAYDFITLRDPNPPNEDTGRVRINLMFIRRPGLLNQPIRSATFVFEPLNAPGGLISISADPGQAQNQMAVGVEKRLVEVNGQEYEARVLTAVIPVRGRRIVNGNEQEQQGSAFVTVYDFYPFSFRRPKPDQPRDRISIIYTEPGGYRFPPAGEYVAEISEDPTIANFFVHGRIVD